jgi:hypothetical protein
MKLFPVLLAMAICAPAAAEAQSIAGTWTASYPRAVRNINGVQDAEIGTAVVTLEVKGDSVFGTWLTQNTPNPAKPRALKGTFANGKLSLVAEAMEATVRRGGETSTGQTISMIGYFEAELKDGKLEGTMRNESTDGTVRNGPLNWSATREASGK